MAGALARFFQQQLQSLLSKHELRVQELQVNVGSWMKRCEELQSKGAEESNVNKDENGGETKRAFVEKLHKQLGAKNSKLQKLNNVVHQLERKIASLTRTSVLEGRLASGYEQTKQQSKHLVDQITTLKQQKQQLQAEIARCRELKSVNNTQMKGMEEKLQRERERIRRLTKELAKYRQRERPPNPAPPLDSSSSSSSSKESCKAKLENHVKHLNDKLSKVERRVKALNKKKEVRDEVTDIEAAFLQNLDSRNNADGGPPEAQNSSSESSLSSNNEQFVGTDKTAAERGRLLNDMQTMDSKVRRYEQDLKASEMKRRSSEQAVLELNEEIRKLKDPAAAEEWSRIARLVARLEEFEAENRELRRVIAVDKEEQIMKLEKEVKKLKGLGRKPASGSVADLTVSQGEKTEAEELEQVIAEKDRLILELRFQHDQAKRRMSEVETRFDILFKEWVEENSHKVSGGKPILGTLPSPGRRFSSAGDEVKKESELQLLVYTMKRVVDKLRKENCKLKQAGLSESRYQKLLKRNKELKNTIDTLNFKIASYGKASPHMQLPLLEKKVQDLTADVQTLTDVNAELIHVLRQAEDIYPDIKDKLRCKSGAPFRGVSTNFQYFADQSRYNSILAKQTREIGRLQEELDKTLQLNNDLIYQIAKREDELDLVHGKLYVRNLVGTEGVKKSLNSARDPRQLKSHATTVINNGCFEVMPGDYMTKPGPKDVHTLDAQLVDEIEELRLKHQNLSEVCKHYEQLLFKYTQQLHVPFKPLTTVQ